MSRKSRLQLEKSHVLNGTTPKVQNRKWGSKKDMFYCHFLKIIRKSRSLSESSVSLFSSVVVSVTSLLSTKVGTDCMYIHIIHEVGGWSRMENPGGLDVVMVAFLQKFRLWYRYLYFFFRKWDSFFQIYQSPKKNIFKKFE